MTEEEKALIALKVLDLPLGERVNRLCGLLHNLVGVDTYIRVRVYIPDYLVEEALTEDMDLCIWPADWISGASELVVMLWNNMAGVGEGWFFVSHGEPVYGIEDMKRLGGRYEY